MVHIMEQRMEETQLATAVILLIMGLTRTKTTTPAMVSILVPLTDMELHLTDTATIHSRHIKHSLAIRILFVIMVKSDSDSTLPWTYPDLTKHHNPMDRRSTNSLVVTYTRESKAQTTLFTARTKHTQRRTPFSTSSDGA